ncbi:MAG: TlyA family RNA methyltransferase [Pseudomonadota bacterium]
MHRKMRVDQLLVERNLLDSRAAARASIEAGLVRVDGHIVGKPSIKVSVDADISAEPAHPYVSRGGIKLAHALDSFEIDPGGFWCVDLGASTGGFTDVLLQRGAAQVVAVDVGHGQLHPRLRSDPRVEALEQTDVRSLSEEDVPPETRLLVADLSFISLEKALPSALTIAPGGCQLVALFKPQFEVGRAAIGKGGIVKDSDAVSHARMRTEEWLSDVGWPVLSWADSPISGGDGNREYLVCARKLTSD